MNTAKLRMIVAAAAVSVVALGPAASVAFAEKPRDGKPHRAEASRFARGDDRSRHHDPGRFARGDERGRGNAHRHDDRGRDRGSDGRRGDGHDRDHGGGRRHDSRDHDSRHYAPPAYQPARHRHYTYHDTRWNHRHYYPPRGYYYPYAPRNAVIVHHHRHRYYYGGGIWYAPRGVGWAVVAPPLGIFVSLLPPFYSTIWFGGIPYYYANDVYYLYRERERAYEVVEPPFGRR